MSRLIAIDPGKRKCGVLLVDLEKEIVLEGKVVGSSLVISLLKAWEKNGTIDAIILGNGTTSNYWESKLSRLFPLKIVEERGTTLRARKRYWELWPPSIWMRWIPKGLMVPKQPLDALAALVLLEDYLNKKITWPDKPNFRILHEQ